ncbi:tripartite tricarboxylate transporter substrate binding protein [Polynucleobacter kasalickyi]|uniref:Tripartite-type tricarboxylate transporter, receptor component TctC n=1 Tax=Polynucleobacter kasalickyi TaxID=1938817 RepID=A0A1W1ZWL9_9BURK|nr:tripartite tricarboxylate transporter substrate binding protein [Polynucleobacter kasalickyi]SMC52849.1 Tripartite-type tricarboxylate transporter, receptor component TctC [Polynucleobacter kasalickyi]
MMIRQLMLALLSFLSFATHYAFAEEPYPTRPINLIVPNPPGGSSDVNARILADSLTKILKQPVVVNFKPGVAGQIGNSYVAKSKPDGYNLLMGLSSIMVSPEAERVQGKTSLYEVDQLIPVGMISNDPMVMLVNANSPWNTLADVVKAAKVKPGSINYSSSGNFGPIHLSVVMFEQAAGINLVQVPFGGGGPSMMALLGSQVEITTAIPAVAMAQIQSGKVRAIAVSGPRRIKILPNIPTYRESGYDAEFNIWNGLFVPQGTPDSIVKVLRDAIREAATSGELESVMQQRGMIYEYLDQPEFKKFAKEDGDRMVKAVKLIGKLN